MAKPPPSKIIEVSPLENFTQALEQFYGFVKLQMGSLADDEYLQLQLAAVPVDVSDDYPYFALGNLNRLFDIGVQPKPVSDALLRLDTAVKLSSLFEHFVNDALNLVDTTDLTPDQIKKCDELANEIERSQKKVQENESKLSLLWKDHCEVNGFAETDLTRRQHWIVNQPLNTEIVEVQHRANIAAASLRKIRMTTYESPDHMQIAQAAADVISGGSRMRWPRREDTLFPEADRKNFSLTYLASLSDSDSSLFRNMFMATPSVSIEKLSESTLGHFDSGVTKEIKENDEIKTDWGVSGSYGSVFFKVKVEASDVETVKEEFSNTTTITIHTEATMKIPIDYGMWFKPELFNNAVILENSEIFGRYLLPEGTLRYYPTHVVVARGMKIEFESHQNWQWDFDKLTKGGAGASFFGIPIGGGGSTSKHEKRQRIHKDDRKLTLDDGKENIRLLGYVVRENRSFDRRRDVIGVDPERAFRKAFPSLGEDTEK